MGPGGGRPGYIVYTRVPAQPGNRGTRPSLFVRSGLPMASHLIDCDGLSVCGSSTRTLVTSITDTPAGHDTPRRPRALAPLVTSAIRGEESSGVSTPRTDASWALDIEHVYVDDDPRKWSRKLKVSLFRFIYLVGSARAHPSAFSLIGMDRRVYCTWPSLLRWLLVSVVAYSIVRNLHTSTEAFLT